MGTSRQRADLTGITFGSLAVLRRAPNDLRNKTCWWCRCACGNDVIVSATHLLSSHTSSCGHDRSKADLTGTIFAKLTVLRPYGVSAHRKSLWLCRCECGNELSVPRGSLKSGNTRSCGKCPNRIEHLGDGTTAIILERLNKSIVRCYIDTADYSTVKGFRWHVQEDKKQKNATTYAAAHGAPAIHVLIFGPTSEGKTVDHKDGNGLNNRRSNLREATPAQQCVNRTYIKKTSKYRGVRPADGNFCARITEQGETRDLGRFKSEVDAAKAYDAEAKRVYGEFARLNFPDEVAA